MKRTGSCHQQSYMRPTAVLILLVSLVQIMLYGYWSFRYKFFSRKIVSRRPWLKERRIFTQNVFLVHPQTILEVNDIFVQFHCLRWLDWIFLGGYLPSLSVNYVGMSKDMEKRLPQLYCIKMKISYDLGFIAIGVAMAT